MKPCSVELNKAECDDNSKKNIAKKSERKEEKELVKQNIKENKEVPTKVSTEVEEPKKIEQSEKPVDVKENIENDVNFGIVKGETPEERARRIEVIQDSFTIKDLEDKIDKVLTTRTEMKNTKDRIDRLKAVLTLLSREDAVVEFEYVDKEEVTGKTNDGQSKEFKTVILDLYDSSVGTSVDSKYVKSVEQNNGEKESEKPNSSEVTSVDRKYVKPVEQNDGEKESEKPNSSEGMSVDRKYVKPVEQNDGEKESEKANSSEGTSVDRKYVKPVEQNDGEKESEKPNSSNNVNETKKEQKKTVHFAMDNEDILFDDKNPDLQIAIQTAISTVDQNIENSGFGNIDEAYEKFPCSQNKPYSVQTEDITDDESPEKEIKVDTITEKEIKVDSITGRLVMATVRKIKDSVEDGTEKEKNETLEKSELDLGVSSENKEETDKPTEPESEKVEVSSETECKDIRKKNVPEKNKTQEEKSEPLNLTKEEKSEHVNNFAKFTTKLSERREV